MLLVEPWYAVRTRSRHEAVASTFLKASGFEEFLPTYSSRRQWSDRVKVVSLPLFSGYLFCRFDPRSANRVLAAPGVVKIVGFGGQLQAVPEAEIEAIRLLMQTGLSASPCPYLREGDAVRVRRGPLKGLDGHLLKVKNQFQFVLSLHLLQRSICVELDAEAVEAVR
ncbi:MAG: UpxY family transcription antiterminator [Bryobacterales bacterium]|nr:UpxY family transcription antiterminator [Bryobacterales bacterium]